MYNISSRANIYNCEVHRYVFFRCFYIFLCNDIHDLLPGFADVWRYTPGKKARDTNGAQ